MEKISIEQVLEHYGADRVPTSHRWRAMKCPLHEDSLASASVNVEKGMFKCFACDIYGDGLDIIQKQEGFDFAESVAFAERVFGASVGNVLSGPRARTRRKGLSDPNPGTVTGQRTISAARSRRQPLAGA